MLTPDDIKWIEDHRMDDASKLRLKFGADQHMQHLIMQVESRRKYQKKLPRTLQCKAFEFPTALSGEQSTSDKLAEFHARLIAGGKHVVDMTAGLGIDVLHFAPRAASVIAIERDSAVADALRSNSKASGLDNVTVVNDDCTEWIKHADVNVDTIFIDPARRGSNGERIFALSQCSPDVTAMLPDIARRSWTLIVKMSPMLDITQVTRELPELTDIYAIGTTDECKELVAVVKFDSGHTGSPSIHAVTLTGEQENQYQFTPEEESTASIIYGLPHNPQYLYEPFPAVMKTAPFRLLSQQYGIAALHPNTHLYASEHLATEFPGIVMAIDEILPFSSSALKKLQHRRIEASVTTRNFTMNAAALSSRIKNKESSTHRLFGVSVANTPTPDMLIMTHLIKP